MKFMDQEFLLQSETARRLFHDAAEHEPIIDFHNHLNPQEILEDRCFDNIADVWLSGDHYKWRAMRTNGVSENLITGNGDPYDKFLAWADTVQNCIGNPLYHWTHLELQRYFGIEEPLSLRTADKIWNACNEKLQTREFSVRNLLRMQHVSVLCTTDDPADDLHFHKALAREELGFSVLPSFRPEKALGIEKEGFTEYLEKLGSVSDTDISSVSGVLEALRKRLVYFTETGCRVTDHSLESAFYIPAEASEVEAIFQKARRKEPVSETDAGKYRGFLLRELGREYARLGLVMQLHIGALRNNSRRFFEKLGPDTGFDGEADFAYAPQLSALLSAMDETEELPRTILYCLNSKDLDMLAVMAGCFQSNEQGIRGKIQLGSAWWFLDHKRGMEQQLQSLSDVGLISTFIGMLTDSRSFLSFPRHEYFRRILCNKIGSWIENGEYPDDAAYLDKLVRGICSKNAAAYFGF